MSYFPNYFSSGSFSNEEEVTMSQYHTQKNPAERMYEIEQTSHSNVIPCEQVTTVKRNKFSFLWNIKDFREFLDRQYEFTSPIFSENLSSGASKWKMILHPQNIYPEGVNVALQLLILSEVDKSYSVMYKISFVDERGKHHELKIREKVVNQFK